MTNLTIKRVGVLSLAKIFGLITFVIGIIIGVIYGLVIILVGSALLSQAGGDAGPVAALGGVVGGILMMILIPIMYGALGFMMGAVYALIFNVASGFLGGLELQVEGAATEAFAAPPPLPPQQWQADAYQPAHEPNINQPR
jgi:hypothetical protein